MFVISVLGFSGAAAMRAPGPAGIALLTTLVGVPIYFWLRNHSPD